MEFVSSDELSTNKLKVLFIGDVHFKVNNVKESDEMSRKIIELIKERKPDITIVLGDILDRHETIHSTPLCLANDFLLKISELVPLYVLIGNHDID